MKASALILTLNEELNLARCLESLGWCDDIVVLDSLSTDATETVASRYSTRFIKRAFDDYASQRNYGINEIPYENEWILMVDADEVVDPALAKEIEALDDSHIAMYRLRRKDFFMGKWIRHSSGYPTWFGRLVRRGHVHVSRAVNEEYHTTGKIGHLQEHLIHYPFNKGFHDWVAKHNRYSTMEAEYFNSTEKKTGILSSIVDRDPVARRKAFKSLIYSMPGRPLLMFCALYFFRLGFLDGRAGFRFCVLRSFYEYIISCKIKEIELRKKGSPP